MLVFTAPYMEFAPPEEGGSGQSAYSVAAIVWLSKHLIGGSDTLAFFGAAAALARSAMVFLTETLGLLEIVTSNESLVHWPAVWWLVGPPLRMICL